MASRPIVPQQPRGNSRGEVVLVQGAKQKKNVAVADGRNRRALGDIGNLVTVRGIDENKITRPITRSFCAQLLANAQAAAAVENKKKQVCVNVEGNNDKGAVQKKVVAKPKPVPVHKSPKREEPKKEEAVRKKEAEGSSKKKVTKAFSSVLSARSKAACGLSTKPKEQFFDIDAADAENHLAAADYVEDIYKFYKEIEHESRPRDYVESQPEINEKMRAILVDWLIEVHNKFELMPETLYLTINIIDRFLSVKIVPKRELQLVGMSAMLMASKYEEIWAPEVNDLACIADLAYTNKQILVMEKTILKNLEWVLTVPTHYVFLVRFIKASASDPNVESMVYFLAELGMMNYATTIYCCPSMVAASAVYVARCALNKTPFWNDTLKHYTGFSEPQLLDCGKQLAMLHYTAGKGSSRLKAVYRKYSDVAKGSVALISPAKTLLPGDLSVDVADAAAKISSISF